VRVYRSDVSDITRSIAVLEEKIDEIAIESGVEGHRCTDVESALGALPFPARRRTSLMLQAAQAQAEMSANRAMLTAASYMLVLAQEVWTARADNDEGLPMAQGGLPRGMRHN
jgi:hypothetical protein